MPTQVSDALSNAPEQIEHTAKTIGRSELRLKVFSEIYHGRKKSKTAKEIADRTNLTEKQVLIAGKALASNHIVRQIGTYGHTAYEKIDFFHHHKKKILSFVKSPEKLAKFPTKRKSTPSQVISVPLMIDTAKTRLVTIDDVDSFCLVQSVGACGNLPNSISEKKFKNGVKAILNETGKFTDWGGEKNDLFTTRLRIGGKRYSAAFGFKGPGQTGKLTPKKMGKNGDQIQRLFESPAQAFFVQYWREIDESVLEQLEMLAIAKSVMTGKEVIYGIIDGQDSNRLMQAYSAKF